MTYVIGVNEQKMVQSLYWGSRLSFSSEIPKAKTGAENHRLATGDERQDLPRDDGVAKDPDPVMPDNGEGGHAS